MRLGLAVLVMAAVLAGCGREADKSGAALYLENCAVCHGADARGGGGGGVEGLGKTPPDLAQLAVRNDGVFPTDRVLLALEGYGADGRHWPQMARLPALESDRRARVRVEGTRVRTSAPKAALLVYLETVQAR